jgi:excinuclease ABC subunit B
VRKGIGKALQSVFEQDYVTVAPGVDTEADALIGKDLKTVIAELEVRMRHAAADLAFEEAARLRDEIRRLEAQELGLAPSQATAERSRRGPPRPFGPGGGGAEPRPNRHGGRARRGP